MTLLKMEYLISHIWHRRSTPLHEMHLYNTYVEHTYVVLLFRCLCACMHYCTSAAYDFYTAFYVY